MTNKNQIIELAQTFTKEVTMRRIDAHHLSVLSCILSLQMFNQEGSTRSQIAKSLPDLGSMCLGEGWGNSADGYHPYSLKQFLESSQKRNILRKENEGYFVTEEGKKEIVRLIKLSKPPKKKIKLKV